MVDTVRAFGVMLVPSLVLDLYALLGTWAVMTGWVFRHRERLLARLLRPLAILGAILPWIYTFFIRPWHLRWGATDEEVEKSLPGDELVPDPATESTRAILRSRTARGLEMLYDLLGVEIPHFIMERRMLKGIKERAERAQATWSAEPS